MVKTGIVDIINPQIYRRDFNSYKQIIDKLVLEQSTNLALPKFAPGILMKLSSYVINSDYLLQAIEYNRIHGIKGEVFFFYEGLRENNNQLAKVLRNNIYAKSAKFPTISELNQSNIKSTNIKNTNIKNQNLSVWGKLQEFFKNL